jgi:hypothetical protein
MDIVTIACPMGLTDPSVDPATAPIWLDANGIEYQVASGQLEDYVTSDPVEAQPDRVNVIVGMNGLAALAAMRLTVKESGQ